VSRARTIVDELTRSVADKRRPGPGDEVDLPGDSPRVVVSLRDEPVAEARAATVARELDLMSNVLSVSVKRANVSTATSRRPGESCRREICWRKRPTYGLLWQANAAVHSRQVVGAGRSAGRKQRSIADQEAPLATRKSGIDWMIAAW
jgi:hypothetical protein